MDVSVETLAGLERKLSVTVPTNKIEEEVSLRLRDLARKVKIDGFRPGKAPLGVVKGRYSANVREDVARELIRSTLHEAINDSKLVPAGTPNIEPGDLEEGKPFTYVAYFEVMPEITIKELKKDKIETVESEITSKDVDEALEKLREQHKEWIKVTRPVADGDKINLDYAGYLDKELFEGGSAQGQELIIGSGSMIPGFEKGIIGGEIGKPFEIKVTFPKDYHDEKLANKKTVFKITINDILEGKLPPLDASFAEKFNIKEGGVKAFQAEIKESMIRELDRRINGMNREKIFDKLIELNPIDLPKALIETEIENLKHELYHNLFGHHHSDDEKIPDFPRELFESRATRRVHLGLLFSKYVEKHEITADPKRVEDLIEKLASAYEDPDELRQWYQKDGENRSELEAVVLEEMTAEKISETATIVKTKKTFSEIMYPKQETK